MHFAQLKGKPVDPSRGSMRPQRSGNPEHTLTLEIGHLLWPGRIAFVMGRVFFHHRDGANSGETQRHLSSCGANDSGKRKHCTWAVAETGDQWSDRRGGKGQCWEQNNWRFLRRARRRTLTSNFSTSHRGGIWSSQGWQSAGAYILAAVWQHRKKSTHTVPPTPRHCVSNAAARASCQV